MPRPIRRTSAPYAYAADSPATDEDPSGATVCVNGGCGTVQALAGEPGAYGPPDKPATFDVTTAYINPDVTWGYWSAAPAYDHLAPALGTPAPTLVVRTVRAVTATQVSTGQPSCAGKYTGMACWDQHTAQTDHGSSLLATLGTVGLALGGATLTIANIAQLGADPITDGAEVTDVGALADNISNEDAEDGARFAAGADGSVADALGGKVPNAITLGRYPVMSRPPRLMVREPLTSVTPGKRWPQGLIVSVVQAQVAKSRSGTWVSSMMQSTAAAKSGSLAIRWTLQTRGAPSSMRSTISKKRVTHSRETRWFRDAGVD